MGQYGGYSEVLVPLMAVDYKCQTDTSSTGGNSYGQPQVVAERCDVATPCYVVFVGQSYVHVGVGMEIYGCYYKCEN